MQNKLALSLFLFILSTITAYAQKWGYATLIGQQGSTSIQLIDTNSAVVKQWSGLSGSNGYSCYMLPGGDIWRTVQNTGNTLNGGGVCGRIQKISWNGTLLFDYVISDANQVSHHDICPMPNGNVILIVYEKKTAAEVQAAGATINAVRWSEKLIELKPTGLNTAQIVWEWHLWDHLVQNQYPAKANYQASIVQHPELLNINYNNSGGMADWVHMNGIDYNAALDQLVVSSHNLNELYVIDHSTTSAEAASHSGGRYGKGGDFLYRWGNPAAYGASGTAIFNVVHDAHWVPDDCPRAGWLGGFNNKGVSSNTSAVDLFQPPWNGTSYDLTLGQAYQPATYGYRHAANGYSSNMGSSQQLPNGNMLICLATAKKVYEINANGTQIWQYTGSSNIPQAKRYSRCHIENPQVAVATPSPVICAGGSAQLDISVSATNNSTFNYSWGPAGGISDASIQDPLISGIQNSTTYTVTVTTSNGCSATASIPVTVSPAPQADAGDDVTIISGESTTLTATGGVGYLWSTGENTAQITVSPGSNTTYAVTVTNAAGCTATDAVSITVLSPITVSAAATNQAFCLGGSTQLSASVSGGSGNYTYQWASSPAGFFSTQPNPVVSPNVTTQYTVTVTDGAVVATAAIQVIVFPLPAANAGSDRTILNGSSATLTASGGATYAWSTGDQSAGISVSPTETTTYTVTVTDVNGCTATDELTVTVTTEILPLEGAVSTTDSAICVGDAVQLLATALYGSGTYTFNWTSDPAGFSSTLQDPYVNPEQTTTYNVEISDGTDVLHLSIVIIVHPQTPAPVITATDNILSSSSPDNNQWFYYGAPIPGANGQQHIATQDGSYQVQVIDANGCFSPLSDPYEYVAPAPLDGAVTATDQEICRGEVIQLLATGLDGSGTYSYSWTSAPPGFESTLPDPFVNPEENTVYFVVISDGTNSITLQIPITVFPLEPQPVITVAGDSLISSSPTNNQWFYYGALIPGATGQVYIPTQGGSYQVQVSDQNGCFSPLSEPYEVSTESGVAQLTLQGWGVAPNPAYDQIRLLGELPDDFRVEIWNSAGVLVHTESNSRALSVGTLPGGVYQLRVQAGSAQGVQKIVLVK